MAYGYRDKEYFRLKILRRCGYLQLLDQNIPALIEPWLQDLVGETASVTSTRSLGFQQREDDEIFYYRQDNKMVIITYDEDFQNPLLIKETPGCGVIRLNVYPKQV